MAKSLRLVTTKTKSAKKGKIELKIVGHDFGELRETHVRPHIHIIDPLCSQLGPLPNFLRNRGFEVDVSNSIVEASEEIEQDIPNLIFIRSNEEPDLVKLFIQMLRSSAKYDGVAIVLLKPFQEVATTPMHVLGIDEIIANAADLRTIEQKIVKALHSRRIAQLHLSLISA